MNNEQFMDSIQGGKWMKDKLPSGKYFIVKLFPSAEEKGLFYALWLSHDDTESITFNEYDAKNWDYKNGGLHLYGSFCQHIGSYERGPNEYMIYDEEDQLDENRLFSVLLKEVPKEMLNEEELHSVWSDIKERKWDAYETLVVHEG